MWLCVSLGWILCAVVLFLVFFIVVVNVFFVHWLDVIMLWGFVMLLHFLFCCSLKKEYDIYVRFRNEVYKNQLLYVKVVYLIYFIFI